MPISASILYNLVICPQRVALDAFGNPTNRDEPNAFVKLLWDRGTLFERETIDELEQPFLDLSEAADEDKEKLTLQAMQRGEPLIYSGRISADDLLGVPDLLRKEAGRYIPGDIKSGAGEEGGGDDLDGKPKLHYAVQLALYVDILERLRLSSGRRAFVWDVHGDEVLYNLTVQQGPRKPETLWDEYQSALTEARAILAKRFIPQAAYSAACKLCHWYTFCVEQLSVLDDLTLIPALGRTVRDKMQAEASTIAEFSSANLGDFIDGKKSIFPGLGPDRLRLFHSRAVMLKSTPPKPYLRAPVTLHMTPIELFFDVQVDPLRNICYLHGIVERRGGDNETERFVYFFASDLTPDAEREAFTQAYAYLSEQANATIYFYSKYERTTYRKLRDKYPNVCSHEDIDRLFDPTRAVDLYGDVVLKATEWPTRDHSIKTLAKYLGFNWRDTHPSGAASVEWFDRWCREHDPAVKQRILDYNEDDCRATRVLLDGIRQLNLLVRLSRNLEEDRLSGKPAIATCIKWVFRIYFRIFGCEPGPPVHGRSPLEFRPPPWLERTHPYK
jgi:predicted RecB family nuclease